MLTRKEYDVKIQNSSLRYDKKRQQKYLKITIKKSSKKTKKMLTRKSSYGKIREYQITREKTYKISNNLTTKYYKHRDY